MTGDDKIKKKICISLAIIAVLGVILTLVLNFGQNIPSEKQKTQNTEYANSVSVRNIDEKSTSSQSEKTENFDDLKLDIEQKENSDLAEANEILVIEN